MSLHYLLDGYNIIQQVPRLKQGTLEDGRRRLLAWLNTAAPQGSGRNAVTVVFDGTDEHFGGAGDAGNVKVIFTRHGSADDYIKAIVEAARNKKQFVVVSDDKGIKLYVRALGAETLSVKTFAAGLLAPGKTKAAAAGSQGKYVPLAQAHKINKELEKIWLK